MSTTTYLTFQLQNLQYAIGTDHVLEIFPLPELQIVPEIPNDMLGVLNLRGTVLPVMHLRRRLGQTKTICSANDTVVVVECQGLKVGVIVDQVSEVYAIDDREIQQDLTYGRANHINTAFLRGVAQLDDSNILLLNPEALITQADEVSDWMGESDSLTVNVERLQDISRTQLELSTDFYQLYFPAATEAERQLLQKRAAELRQLSIAEDNSRLIPLAVFELSGEYFGMNLELVREFIKIQNVRTIPCCPAQIIGNMNLRGEIMTLVDIRPALNLDQPLAGQAALKAQISQEAIVAQLGDLVAGISIDELHDILYLDPSDLATLPVANQSSRQGLVASTIPYRDQMLSILNLPELLRAA
jgi:purine-binding chemotaxis protein CheW